MRRRALLVTAVVVGAVVLLLAGPGTTFYTDLLWYREVDYSQLFTTRLWTQVWMFALAAGIWVGVAGINVWIARRLSPLRPLAITNDFLFNLRRSVDPVMRWVVIGVLAAGTVAFASSTLPFWEEITLFFNNQPFGAKDPVFGNDIGFYVFALPVWEFVVGWLFAVLVVTTLIVAALYAYAGAIGPQPEGGYLAPQPRNHLAILLGFILLLKAASYQIDQWELLYSPTGGQVIGASYTDVNAYLPAYRVLFFIAILAALLLFATFLTKRLVLPIVAIALMALSALIIGGIYPRIVQQFTVEPNELSLEEPYIENGIQGTLKAYGLDNVVQEDFDPATQKPQPGELLQETPTATLRNMRIWDDSPLIDNMNTEQRLAAFYRFNSVAVDRYAIAGNETQVLVSARELDTQAITNRTWQNDHLVFTHGYAPVIAATNASVGEGRPAYLVDNIPPRNVTQAPQLEVERPQIYFGQITTDYVVVNSKLGEADGVSQGATSEAAEATTSTTEGDTPTTAASKEETTTTSPGEEEETQDGDPTAGTYRYPDNVDSGIRIDSFLKRLAFSLRMRDVQLLLSGDITPESRIMFNRQVSERVQRVAPFLTLDSTPYLSVIEGKLFWIVDAYTTSDLYPYSEPSALNPFAGQNYVRNSVKATVDAFTGEIKLYRVDGKDPIAKAWDQALPGLFQDEDEVSDELRLHFRYPLDLFSAQLLLYQTYHMTDPTDFYNRSDEWEVAQVRDTASVQPTTTSPDDLVPSPSSAGIAQVPDSQYLIYALPGEAKAEMVLSNSFTPVRQQEGGSDNTVLRSLLVARSDPENYGQLVDLRVPRGRTIQGPAQVESLINSNEELSATKTLLDQSGSEVSPGQIRILPINNALLYVQPWYVTGKDADLPRLNRVILVFNEEVQFGNTFGEALLKMLGLDPFEGATVSAETPPAPGPEAGTNAGTAPSTAADPETAALIASASQTYEEMQQALRQGDLAEYGRLEGELGRILQDLRDQTSSGG